MSIDNRRQKVRQTLALIDITGRTADVFVVLLEHGSLTAAEIAQRARSIPRTSIYDIVKTLQYHGLVSSVTRNDQVYYQVQNIEHIADTIEVQKRELTEKQNAIRMVADVFQQFKSGTVYEPGIRYFEGRQGIRAIQRELQNARQETRTIVDVASVSRTFPRILVEDNLQDFQKHTILKKDLMIHSPEAERYLRVAPVSEFHRVKWLPSGMTFQTDTFIWEGHVAVIDYSDPLSGIIIDNPTIAATFVAWFEMMWASIAEEVRK